VYTKPKLDNLKCVQMYWHSGRAAVRSTLITSTDITSAKLPHVRRPEILAWSSHGPSRKKHAHSSSRLVREDFEFNLGLENALSNDRNRSGGPLFANLLLAKNGRRTKYRQVVRSPKKVPRTISRFNTESTTTDDRTLTTVFRALPIKRGVRDLFKVRPPHKRWTARHTMAPHSGARPLLG